MPICALHGRPGISLANLANLLLTRAAACVAAFSAERYAFSAALPPSASCPLLARPSACIIPLACSSLACIASRPLSARCLSTPAPLPHPCRTPSIHPLFGPHPHLPLCSTNAFHTSPTSHLVPSSQPDASSRQLPSLTPAALHPFILRLATSSSYSLFHQCSVTTLRCSSRTWKHS